MEAEIEAGTKVAVITGGASGIGRATAAEFAACGYRVAVWDVDQDAAVDLCASLPDAIAVDVDISKPVEVQQALATTIDELGRLDVLVAGAAVGTYGAIVETSDTEWRRIMSTDVDGTFWCVREAARKMKASGGGSIVLIGSDRGVQPEPGWTPYCVAKAAVIQLGRAAAVELAPDIRVNVVNPGPTDTPLLDQTRVLSGVHERITQSIPLQRLATPEEIATAAVFAAEHPFMTGSVLSVDGGMALAGTFGIREAATESAGRMPRPQAGGPALSG